jgi:hypothetical protein
MRYSNLDRFAFVLAVGFFSQLVAPAQSDRYPLERTIPAPAGVGQSVTGLGRSVAMDGTLAVVGAPYTDIGGPESGAVQVFNTETGERLHLLVNPTPAEADFFGISVGISGSRVVVGAYRDDTDGAEVGIAYVYDLAGASPTVPALTLRSPIKSANQRYGFSVAIDGTHVVIGARTGGAAGQGRAYVYDLANLTPTVPIVTLNNGASPVAGEFGTSVAISGSYVVVGAKLTNNSGATSGSALVFDIATETPDVPLFTFSSPTGLWFGQSVAISGSRVIVGSPLDSGGGNQTGSAYVYDLESDTPTIPMAEIVNPAPVAPLPPGAVTDAEFGFSVAILGMRVAIGAPSDDNEGVGTGRAYVYDLNDGAPATLVATLKHLGPFGDLHGSSVALNGTRLLVGAESRARAYIYNLAQIPSDPPVTDLVGQFPSDNDGFGASVATDGSRLVVGAQNRGSDGVRRVFVYDLANPGLDGPVLELKGPNASTTAFGRAVAVSGSRVIVADPGTALNGSNGSTWFPPKVYLYDMDGVDPSQPVVVLEDPNPVEFAAFGRSVAISGPWMVVGVPGGDFNGPQTGKAYIYNLDGATPLTPIATLTNPSPSAADRFGAIVAIEGSRVYITDPSDDTRWNDAGAVFVYDLNTVTSGTPVQTVPGFGSQFGGSLAVDGSRLLVGALSNPGRAYLYDLAGPAPTEPTMEIPNPNPPFAARAFGGSVAMSGTRCLIGDVLDDDGKTDAGAAYVFEATSGTPSVPLAKIRNPFPGTGDDFGGAVAIEGERIVVGARRDDTFVTDKGSVYVFRLAETTTLPPVLNSPAAGVFIRKLLTVNFVLPEPALPRSVTLTFVGTQTITLTLAASQETSGAHSVAFDPSNPTASPDIISGSAIPDGAYTITLSYRDALGNPVATATSENVRIDSVDPIFPLTEKVVGQGEDVPGAGTPDGPPANAKFASFGVPAIDAEGHVTFTARWTSGEGNGSGIFRDDAFVAKVGGAVPGLPGATFKSFTEPAINAGRVAFLATSAGVPKAQASVLVSDVSGIFETLAQTGVSAPGTGEATFKSFKSISVSGDAAGVFAQLTPGTGSLRTTSANDLGIWVKEGANPLVLVLREGQDIAPSKKIKTLTSFAGGNGSPGQGRGWLIDTGDSVQVLARATLTDKSQAIVAVALDDLANPTIVAESGAGSSFASLGLPATNGAAQTVFLGSLTAGDNVTKANSRGIFADLDGSGAYLPVVRVGGPAAPDESTFSQLKDPVLADDGSIAFLATVQSRTVKGVGAQTLWWQPPGEEGRLFARGGIPAAETPGAQWKSFQSLAIAANRGPIFTGTLVPGKGGVTKATANGLWATDFEGNLRLLVQSGVTQIDGKTVKSFTLLNANVGSQGTTRSFNDNAFVVWRATFDDKSQAIIRTEVP